MSKTPRVHSRHYHLQFDITVDSALGYVCPTPAAAPAGWDAAHGGTSIVLPLVTDAGAQGKKLRELEVAVGELQPTLLLFLHQLRRLVISASDGSVSVLRRASDPTDPHVVVLEMSHYRSGGDGGGGRSVAGQSDPAPSRVERFLVAKRMLQPRAAGIHRLDIERTVLTLAFPLPAADATAFGESAGPAVAAELPALDVFAFLPLRSYGLSFVVQADWEIPPSRESVDASSAWNQWLLSEAPPLFLEAAEELLRRAGDAADGAERARLANHLYQLVPLHATEFFKPLAAACCQLLRRCACVPVRDGAFCEPRQAVLATASMNAAMAPDDLVTDSTNGLIRAIGLQYAHGAVRMPPALVRELGVRSLDASLLTELLESLAPRWAAGVEAVDVAWLAWAFQEIGRDAQHVHMLPTLRQLHVLPLADGSLGCAAGAEPVYELPTQLQHSALSPTALVGLRMLQPAFLAASSRDALCLLGLLGVQRITADALLSDHLLPALTADATPPAELPALLALARQLTALCRTQRCKNLPKLLCDARARLLASDGGVWRLGETLQLHLPPSLGTSSLFVPVPPPPAWLVLSELYAEMKASFLIELGVHDFPAVVPGEAADDWASPALEALLSTLCAAGDRKRLRHLAAAIVERRVQLLPKMGTPGEPSSLLTTLRAHAWLPGSDNKLHTPGALWVRSAELEAILGGARGTVWSAETLPIELAAALDMRHQLSASVVCALLAEWAALPGFNATVEQMAALYCWLAPLVSADEQLRASLQEVQCIWVPDHPPLTEHDGDDRRLRSGRVLGRFYRPRECVLDDSAKLIDSMNKTVSDEVVQLAASAEVRVLSRYYVGTVCRGVWAAFEALGLLEQPTLRHYTLILSAAAAAGPPSPAARTAAYRIFCNWAYAEQQRQHEEEDEEMVESSLKEAIAAAVGKQAVFPTAHGGWSALHEVHFYVPTPRRSGATARSADLAGWSALALAHVVEARPAGPPYDSVHLSELSSRGGATTTYVKNLEDNLLRFYADVLQLKPLTSSVHEVALLQQPNEDVLRIAGAASARVCVAAGVLQRHSASALAAPQRERLRLSLQALSVLQVPAKGLSVLRELRTPSGDLLERTTASERAVHLEPSTANDGGAPLLYATPDVKAQEYAHALCRLLPMDSAQQVTEAMLAMLPLLNAAWLWDMQRPSGSPNAVLEALLVESDLPQRDGSESRWLVWTPGLSAASSRPAPPAPSVATVMESHGDDEEVAMLQVLERERLMSLPPSDTPLPEGDVPLTDGALGPALHAAMQARRERAQQFGSAVGAGRGISMYPSGSTSMGGKAGSGGFDSGGGFGNSGDFGGGSGRTAPTDGSSVQMAQWEAVDPAVLEYLNTETGPAVLSTGRWGEKLVSRMLQHAMPAEQVDWVNAEEELGLPYDVCVRRDGEIVLCAAPTRMHVLPTKAALPTKAGPMLTTEYSCCVPRYAEVKSTSEEAKAVFELSLAELDLARRVGPRYTIYRVFGACSSAPRVAQLLDPARQLMAGGMQLLVAPKQ